MVMANKHMIMVCLGLLFRDTFMLLCVETALGICSVLSNETVRDGRSVIVNSRKRHRILPMLDTVCGRYMKTYVPVECNILHASFSLTALACWTQRGKESQIALFTVTGSYCKYS